MRRPFILAALLAGVALCSDARRGCATKIDPLPWQQLALQADFVGVVECEVAGGNVAEYRVVEVWKGRRKVGDHFRIADPPDYWAGQYHLALCGERYYVTTFESDPPANLVSTTAAGPVPLWWRKIPADYRLPFLQGKKWLHTDKDRGDWLDARRKEAQALLALKREEQEAELLRVVIERRLAPDYRFGVDSEKAEGLKRLVEQKAAVADLVRELLRVAPGTNAPAVRYMLANAGGAVTLSILEKVPARSAPWEDHAGLMRELRARLGKAEQETPPKRQPEPELPWGDATLRQFRATLAAGPRAERFGHAFTELSRHDPAAVADFLVGAKDLRDAYVLSSTFAVLCLSDRAKYFKALLAAKVPYVRVAAAVYLCYEDEEAGVAALKKLTALEGEPGTWAALTLARRGHADAVPRLLEVFREADEKRARPGDSPDEFRARAAERDEHDNLQARALELLSNSAKKSDVPQPPAWTRPNERFGRLAAWWKQHGDKVKPHDPWLELLAKQKVD
jgi:hypothetical protein